MCLSVILVAACLGVAAGSAPVAETAYGPLRGHLMTSLSGREFLAFSGVPYARPPVGTLRFKDPVVPEKHEGVLDATSDGEDCFQDDHFFNKYPQDLNPASIFSKNKKFVGSEDCLYLNVYTPSLKPSSPLPVMFFIHGGAFKIGSGSSSLHGPEILMDKDIVLVTINYRLGVLGFLRTDDTILPGNLGLKDQVVALKWVKENIANFGGNPDSVTIFGESAGGASVHLQMHSPLSQGLVHRVIAQSGTGDSVWAIKGAEVSEEIGNKYLEIVGCKIDKAVECLQEKSVEELHRLGNEMMAFPLDILFSPVFESDKDSSFITKESFSERSSLPLLSGINSAEGLIIIGELFIAGDRDFSELQKKYKWFLPTLLNYGSSPDKDVITSKIKEFYLGSKDFGLDTLDQTVQLFSDGLFNSALYKSSKKHKGPIYLYYLSYMGEKSFANFIPNLSHKYGVDHGDDLLYLFHLKKFFPKLKFNEKDGAISKLMVDLWVNFATYGEPTPDGVPVKWQRSKNAQGFVEIGADGLRPEKKLFDSDKMQFWEFLTAYKHVHTEL